MIKTLKVLPHGGINRIFPEHKLVGKETQKVQALENLLSLDGRIQLFSGATALNSSALSGDIKWAKRIYCEIGGDRRRYQFCVSAGKFYKLNEALGTLNQVTIDNSVDPYMETDVYPIDCTMKVAEQVTTYLVDGKNFYKFVPNEAGEWNKLPTKTDVDGNDVEPIFVAEYLDRLAVLTKNRNVLILSKNLDPETLNDATDSVLVDLPSGNGGFPVGLIVFRGFLWIIHEDYIAPLSGSSPSTFGVKPGDVIRGFGSRAPRSIVNLKTHFSFLNSRDNEVYVSGGTVDSTEQLSQELDFKSLVSSVKSNLTTCHLDTTLNCLRIAYVAAGEAALNDEEIYSLDEKKWCGQTRDRYVSCYSQWNGNGDDGRVITGRSDTGKLMWEDESLGFDGSAIHYKLATASYVADEDTGDVQFEEFFLDLKASGNYNIPLAYYLDSRITTSGVEQVNMQGEIINLGLIEISDQNSFLNRAIPFIDYSRGRMIRFEIEENQANRRFELYGIYAKYNTLETKAAKYIYGR